MIREDVTRQYKFPEGSQEERNSFQLAYAHGSRPRYQHGQIIEKDGEKFDVEINLSKVNDKVVGNDLEFEVFVKNYTKFTAKDIDVLVIVHSCTYNSSKFKLVKKVSQKSLSVDANGKTGFLVKIGFEDYFDKLVDRNDFLVTASAKVNGKLFVDSNSLQLDNPRDCVEIVIEKKMEKGREHQFSVKVVNPLTIDLKDITVTLEGFGIEEVVYRVKDLVIEAGKGGVIDGLKITPTRSGPTPIYVDVDCAQLQNLKADAMIYSV